MEFLLRFFFGAVVCSGGFLVGCMGRLALREVRKIGFRAAVGEIYFWAAAEPAVGGLALTYIAAYRLIASFRGLHTPENIWGWLLVVAFGLLFLAYAGFNWAGTRTFAKGRTIWSLFMSSLALWLVFLIVWTVAK